MPSKEPSKTKSSSKKVKSSSSKKQKTPPAPTKSSISAEFVGDSDRDSESDDSDLPEKPVAKAPVKANGSKTTKEKPKKAAPVVEDSEKSASENESEEDEDEESEESSEESAPEPTPKPSQQQISQPSTVNPTPEPGKPLAKYQLPKGFDRKKTKSSSASPKISSMLSKSNLAGKQIFHFTTPASVPAKALKHLKYDDLSAGKVAFTYDGNDYEIDEEEGGDEKEDVKVMIIKDGEKNYTIAKHIKPTKSLHFRQTIPSALTTFTSTTSASKSRATVPKKRPARAQPEGLRIRFRSGEIGVKPVSGGGSEKDESEESSEEDDD